MTPFMICLLDIRNEIPWEFALKVKHKNRKNRSSKIDDSECVCQRTILEMMKSLGGDF